MSKEYTATELPIDDDTTDRDKWNPMIILCLKWAVT